MHKKASEKALNIPKQILLWVGALALLGMGASCGKSLSAQTTPASDSGVPVNGVGGFATQCPYGELSDPQPVQLTAFGCPGNQTTVQLQKPLMPFILQADCTKYEVTVRSIQDTRFEARWKALPDGRFYFTMDAGVATFQDDGSGHANCQAPIELSVQGLMKCRDRDHVHLEVNATWYPGQSMGTEVQLTGARCSFPTSCYLTGFTALNQCGG